MTIWKSWRKQTNNSCPSRW